MFSELNFGKRTVMEGIDTKDMEFRPLKDFIGEKLEVKGYFFTSGKFGEQVSVVTDKYLVNLPKRAVDQFKKIDETPEMLEALLAGKLGIADIAKIDTKNGTTVGYTLIDL